MKFNDAVSGTVLLALALAVIGYSWAMPKMHGQFVGPGMFPGLVGAALAIGALILIVRGVRERAGHPWIRLGDWTRQPATVLRFLAIPLFVLFYVLVSESIGFVPVAFVGLVLLFCVAGKGWGTTLIVSAVTTAAVYYAFAIILRVPLPRMDVLGLPF